MFWLYVNNYYREINKINLTCVSKKFRYFGTLPPRNIYDFKNWRKGFCSSRFWISPPPQKKNTHTFKNYATWLFCHLYSDWMDPSKLNVLYLNLRKSLLWEIVRGQTPSLLPTLPDATCLKYKLHICIQTFALFKMWIFYVCSYVVSSEQGV